ncbi:glutathione transferase GstA [Nitrosomonas eutropha]|uniref:Glutathione S-transferase n=2 Tax=Nitrosomonas eutropha TaxID=916 RepID=A0ABX5M953_9PROT|nr:glutathione transferase GstA [Nitrosomonas eutropha]ABI59602.1 Glutathione S-transferase, C-terminal domain [Nitrosomonas eutropha C91]PXV79820.1 glutathione S-transferase [Nitrosomonas eutropha]SCX26802.1 glutathione S-transferase [Nitrosomonas eutropha]
MKLYYAPGSCSLAPHIALREAGLNFELEKVDLASKQTEHGEDFTKINPNGYVPTLKLDNGEILSEVAVLLQYIADEKPDAKLAPKFGGMERYRLMEWLNFIATEIHKTLGALFHPNITPEWKTAQLATFSKHCNFLADQLDGKQYLLGNLFTIADAYLFTTLSWTKFHQVDMSKWPALTDYMTRIAARPAVIETMQKEGLIR